MYALSGRICSNTWINNLLRDFVFFLPNKSSSVEQEARHKRQYHMGIYRKTHEKRSQAKTLADDSFLQWSRIKILLYTVRMRMFFFLIFKNMYRKTQYVCHCPLSDLLHITVICVIMLACFEKF